MKEEVKVFISDRIIATLVQEDGLSYEEAIDLWYDSKTKKELIDSDNPEYEGLYPSRVYDELMMEVDGNPHWLRGSFY